MSPSNKVFIFFSCCSGCVIVHGINIEFMCHLSGPIPSDNETVGVLVRLLTSTDVGCDFRRLVVSRLCVTPSRITPWQWAPQPRLYSFAKFLVSCPKLQWIKKYLHIFNLVRYVYMKKKMYRFRGSTMVLWLLTYPHHISSSITLTSKSNIILQFSIMQRAIKIPKFST